MLAKTHKTDKTDPCCTSIIKTRAESFCVELVLQKGSRAYISKYTVNVPREFRAIFKSKGKRGR